MVPCFRNYFDVYKDALAFYLNTLGMKEDKARECAKKECVLEFQDNAHYYH